MEWRYTRRFRHNSQNLPAPSTSSWRRLPFKKNDKHKLRENFGIMQCKCNLSLAFQNIDGLTCAKMEDVISHVSSKSPDFFFLLETKRRLEEMGFNINISGYDVTELRRSDLADEKPGGGIAFFTKNTSGLIFNRYTPSIGHHD